MESNYSVQVGDCITSSSCSYKVLKILGSGSYGKVVLCRKSANKQLVALKVLKALQNDDVGQQEAKILQLLREKDSGSHHIVQCMDSFQFKGHYCYEFENLDVSLMDFLETFPTRSLQLQEIRPIIAQMATALLFLKAEGIAHCDMKPDNIMLVDHVGQPLRIKLIDFGLACPVSEIKRGTPLQTFYYKAPEVQIGGTVTESIDMWSAGCIAAELFLGDFLFCGNDKKDLMRHIIEIVGQPPDHVLDSGRRTRQFFQRSNGLTRWEQKMKLSRRPSELTVESLDDILHFNSAQTISPAESYDRRLFVDLLKKMLDVDPETRITPEEVLKHPFVTMSPMKKWFPSYHSANLKIMAQVMNLSEEDQQTASTPASRETVSADTRKTARVRVRQEINQVSSVSSGKSETQHKKRSPDLMLVSSATGSKKRKREEEKEVVVIDLTTPSPPSKHRKH